MASKPAIVPQNSLKHTKNPLEEAILSIAPPTPYKASLKQSQILNYLQFMEPVLLKNLQQPP